MGANLAWDYTTSAEMILRYMDAKILPGYAAIERGSILAIRFLSMSRARGSSEIFSFATRVAMETPDRRPDRREVEERLLTHVIETLQQSPGIHRVEAQLLAHRTGEVARPFLQQGFSRLRASL